MKEEHSTSNIQRPTPNGDPASASAARNTQHATRRYLSIYAALAKNSLAREMSFKSNFLLWIVVDTSGS